MYVFIAYFKTRKDVYPIDPIKKGCHGYDSKPVIPNTVGMPLL